ncbi:MAG: hypothetical protein AVO33_10535 [delta proteobacterium ML8_F1]|nr:MAG: hypothetical protein AVO33_10535 [delta proteobacterium ML8_F1]
MMKNSIVEAIVQHHDFLIMPHMHPDGDAVGSSLALALALEALGKNVRVFSLDPIPYDIAFLKTQNFWVSTLEADVALDYVIALDASDEGRLMDRLDRLKAPLINIDHHKTNTGYGALNWVDETASATGEIIFELIKALDVPLSAAMATALYVAISTDTGSFMYANTTKRTHLIAGELLGLGIDLEGINRHLYQNIPMNKFRLNAYVLEKAEFHALGGLGLAVVQAEDMKRFNCTNTDNIVEALRNIDSVEVAVLVVERDGLVKVSMRSKGAVDVSEIALKYKGGGHVNAAGFSSELGIEETKDRIIKEFSAIGFRTDHHQ